jgi:Cas6 Crispr
MSQFDHRDIPHWNLMFGFWRSEVARTFQDRENTLARVRTTQHHVAGKKPCREGAQEKAHEIPGFRRFSRGSCKPGNTGSAVSTKKPVHLRCLLRLTRVVRIKDKTVVGYGVRVAGLNVEESLRLQEHGLGGRRKLGCGVFVPVRGTAKQ